MNLLCASHSFLYCVGMFAANHESSTWLGIAGVVFFYALGIAHILHALMHARTSQGAIAWVVSLLTIPFVAIPLYWLLGRTKFSGYVRACIRA